MQIFKNKTFFKWAKAEGLTDSTLLTTAKEIEEGLINANLGGSLIKKRIARKGEGKRVVLGLSSFSKKDIELFLFMGSQKISETT